MSQSAGDGAEGGADGGLLLLLLLLLLLYLFMTACMSSIEIQSLTTSQHCSKRYYKKR